MPFQTDLAATAFRREKLIAENRYFGQLPGVTGAGIDNDGILSTILVKDGWKVKQRLPCMKNNNYDCKETHSPLIRC